MKNIKFVIKNLDVKDLKDLEFLAKKSNELLNKQITSYRQKHLNSSTIITVLALFIPFFLNGLDNSYLIIKLISILPIGLIIYAIIFLIQVLRGKPLDQGFHIDKFDELVNKDYEEILLYEIGANKSSFIDNQSITKKSNNKFNFAIKLTVISIIISSILLLSNQFYKPKVISTNPTIMSKINSRKNEKPRVIPVVPPKDRTNLNEGVKPKPTIKKPQNDRKN